MVTKAQKVRLAVFFLVGFAVLLTIIVVLLGSKLTEKLDVYKIVYHDTSVAGLQVGGAVLYRGIRIGRIEDIQIDRDYIENIIVFISVRRGTPIKIDMVATMVTVGITGLKQIELSGGSDIAPFHQPGGTIMAGRSMFDNISDRAEILAEKVERIIDNIIVITEKNNQEKFNQILSNIDIIVDRSNQPLVETIAHIEIITGELAKTSKTLNDILAQIEANQIGRIVSNTDVAMKNIAAINFNEIDTTIKHLNETLGRATIMITRLDGLVQKSSPDITALIEELRETIENLNEFSRLIADDPSILIRSRRQD